jgi:uncharacterized membrane protein
MSPMEHLYAACLAFLVTHFMPSTPLRAPMVRVLGQWPYTGLYSLVAFAAIGWMSWAYTRAPIQPLWEGVRWLPVVVMPISFVLLAGGLFANNPTVVGMYRLLKDPEPARGMIRVTRHPVMWSFLIWALAHVLARGDLRALVFFGTFAVVAGLGTLLMDMRKAKSLGDNWARFAAVTSNVPFLAILQGRNRLDIKEIGFRNPAIGLALFAAFYSFHGALFGSPSY